MECLNADVVESDYPKNFPSLSLHNLEVAGAAVLDRGRHEDIGIDSTHVLTRCHRLSLCLIAISIDRGGPLWCAPGPR